MANAAAAVAAPSEKPKPSAEAADIKAQLPQPITALLASQWKARESGVFFNTHEVVPNADTPLEHLARPEFWGNVSQKMKPGDIILAFPRDGKWYAELLVWDAGQNWANVSPLFTMDRPAFESVAGVASDFDIRRDPIDGITVIRKSTGAKVKGNFPNHGDALRWISEHQRALRG